MAKQFYFQLGRLKFNSNYLFRRSDRKLVSPMETNLKSTSLSSELTFLTDGSQLKGQNSDHSPSKCPRILTPGAGQKRR